MSEEEHRQEREIRELMVNTPEPPPRRESEIAEQKRISPSQEKEVAIEEGKEVAEPNEHPGMPKSAETRIQKEEEHTSVPVQIVAPVEEATSAPNTTVSAKSNKDPSDKTTSTETTSRTSSIKLSRRPSSSRSHPLEKQASQVSVAPGDPTGFTSGLAGGTREKSNALATTTSAAESEVDPDDEFQYPGGLKLALITIGLALATFVVG